MIIFKTLDFTAMKKIYNIDTYTIFNKRNVPKNFVRDCCHVGDCSKDVLKYLDRFNIVNYEKCRNYLKNNGVDETETFDETSIKTYIVWLIACNITETGEFFGITEY